MCDKLPYIFVHFFKKVIIFDSTPPPPPNSILGFAKDKVGIEMQFAQAEREPTSLPACKFTFMKIHNFFFCGRTT